MSMLAKLDQALRQHYSYPAPRNSTETNCMLSSKMRTSLSTEELWELTLEQLNDVFKQLDSQRKIAPTASLLGDHSDITDEIDVKKSIVGYIFEIKRREAEAHA